MAPPPSATIGQMITSVFLLLLLLAPVTQNAKSMLPRTDRELLEFSLNLEYLEAEFFLHGSMGRGLDHIQPGLAGGGPRPIGARIANLSPLVRNIIMQFAYQEVGHIRSSHTLSNLHINYIIVSDFNSLGWEEPFQHQIFVILDNYRSKISKMIIVKIDRFFYYNICDIFNFLI